MLLALQFKLKHLEHLKYKHLEGVEVSFEVQSMKAFEMLASSLSQ